MAETSGQRAKRLRCAIYTRKSSDEGLEQEFNSLHAQREASAAFRTRVAATKASTKRSSILRPGTRSRPSLP